MQKSSCLQKFRRMWENQIHSERAKTFILQEILILYLDNIKNGLVKENF